MGPQRQVKFSIDKRSVAYGRRWLNPEAPQWGAGKVQNHEQGQAGSVGCPGEPEIPGLKTLPPSPHTTSTTRLDPTRPSSTERTGVFSCPPSILERLT